MSKAKARVAALAFVALVASALNLRTLVAQQPSSVAQGDSAKPEESKLPAGSVARLGVPRAVPTGVTAALAVSPDQRLLAVAKQNRGNGRTQLLLLDAKSGDLKRKLADGLTQYSVVAFSDDGNILHASDQSWTVETGDKVPRAIDGSLAAISPNGKFWAVLRAQDGQISVWDTIKKTDIVTIASRSIPGMANAAALTDDGKYLAHSANGQLQLVETATGKSLEPVVLAQNASLVRVLTLPGANRFFAFGYGNRAALVDPAAGKAVLDFVDDANGYFVQAAAAPDGKQIACATSRRIIRVFNAENGETVRDLPIEDYQITAIVYSNDGARLYATGERYGRDSRMFVWNTNTWEDDSRDDGVQGPLRRLLFSPDGKWLAADSVLGKIYLWNIAEKRIERTLAGDAAFDLRFSPDGWLLGAAGANSSYAIWEVRSGDQVFTGRANSSEFNTAASFSPELDRLAVNRSSTLLRVVKIANGETIFETRNQPGQYQGQPNSLAHSPDGKLLAYATDYFSGNAGPPPISLVEIASGTVTRPFKADPTPLNPNEGYRRGTRLYRMQWSPDGATVAATDERGEISLWDARSGDFLHGLGRCEIYPVFSGDGHYVAGFGNNALSLYEIHSGDEVLTRAIGEAQPNRGAGYGANYVQPTSLPENGLTAVAISPDGRTLAGAYRNDDTILLWNLVPLDDAEIARLTSADTSAYEQWWGTLASDSPKAAYAATWRFGVAGEPAVAFLKEHMGPAAANSNDPAKIKQWIGQLDADELSARKGAAQALREVGEAAFPALDEALKNNPSTEMKRAILAIKQPTSGSAGRVAGDPLRRLRAIAALERSGSPAAAEILAALATGDEDRRETRYAKSALERLRQSRAGK